MTMFMVLSCSRCYTAFARVHPGSFWREWHERAVRLLTFEPG